MTIKSIVKMGNAKLATPSLEVTDFLSHELSELITEMKVCMIKNHGVGIAAPQIGCNLRVIMLGFEHNMRYPNEKSVPFAILINPTYEPLSEEIEEAWEGCLSVPGLRGLVPRYKKIRYQAQTIEGKLISEVAEGFHARIIQHECDHINGVLFPQRINDLRFFAFEDELK